ncbi:sulfur-oxidizing protein SoxY [Gammaproteobacteria bacterium]
MTPMTSNRRIFLKSTLATSLLKIAIGSGLLKSTQALAEWPAGLFDAKDMKGALGGDEGTASPNIVLKTPDIAENGAVVSVTVESSLPNVETISILVKDNPHPLSAVFILGPEVLPNISTRIKIAKTSEVIALVKSGDKRFITTKEVKVISGGCGS